MNDSSKDYLRINNLLYEYFRRDEEGNVEAIQRALDDVSLSVHRGNFICILGHNGSGKSTLAKLINALLTPAAGTVIVGGRDTKDPENVLPIRMETGMVFQNPDNQIVAGIVEEDVAFGPENLGVPSEEIIARVEAALKNLDMYKHRRKSPMHLSGGQKQRVAISGVLAMNPKCIIFDEATSMLDPKGKKEVLKTAHRLNKEGGMTIIFITHNMEEAIDADYIYVLEEGKVFMEGSPREIFKDPDLLTAHGLSAPVAVRISDVLRKSGVKLPDDLLTRSQLVEGLVSLCP